MFRDPLPCRLLGRGYPSLCMTVWGGPSPWCFLHQVPVQVVCSVRFRPPPPPSLSPLCSPRPHGRPLRRRPPHWLYLHPSPPTPVCCTCDAQACRARTWRRRRRWIALAGVLHCRLPTSSPPSRLALPFTVRPLARRRCCRLPASWLLGRWVNFHPLPPATVRPPPFGPGPL